MPAAAAKLTAFSNCARQCGLLSSFKVPSSAVCKPILKRFTPLEANSKIFSWDAESGLHSTVISAFPFKSQTFATNSRKSVIRDESTADGVPPPKKTVSISNGFFSLAPYKINSFLRQEKYFRAASIRLGYEQKSQ